MTANRLKLALLSGGLSGEREVSLKSGAQAAAALDPERYEVFRYDPAEDLPRLIQDAPGLDVALVILHGRFGEDGTVQGLLELLGLPYQGSRVMSSALCMNKPAAKDVYRRIGLPVADDLIVDRRRPLSPREIVDRLGLPVVVKPAHEGSSLGMTIAREEAAVGLGLEQGFTLDRFLLIEKYTPGKEITAAVMGNDDLEALPLIEIRPGEGRQFFDYHAKYVPGATEEVCPAPIDRALTEKAQQLALAAHQALYCRGYSRTDMILKDDGNYVVLETNTIPGMTETSLFPQAAQAGGYTFSQMMDRLIELALEED
jgi:D-alanine-D-alanine ligase